MATHSAVTVRLDRLPASRHTLKLITLISLGGWFEFYDLFFTARGRSHRRRFRAPHPRRERKGVAGAGACRRRSQAQARRLDGNVEPRLSRPHRHAGDLPPVSDHRLLGFSSWVVTLLISQGIEMTKSLAYTFIMAIAAPVGPLIGGPLRAQMAGGVRRSRHRRVRDVVFTADHGRRRDRLRRGDHPCGNWFSFSFHAYQAELYPTRIRAQAVGFVYSWSRFSAIFSGFLIAFFLGRYGTVGVFTFIAAAMLIVFVVIGLFGPAVSRRRLEAIAA